jgi:hypothetical protein
MWHRAVGMIRLSAACTRADVRIEATMLGAQPDAAISIIMRSERQPIRPALLVIDVGERAGISKGYAGGTYDDWTCVGSDGDRPGAGSTETGRCGSRLCRASQAAAAEIATRAIDGLGAGAERGYAQCQTSQDDRPLHQPLPLPNDRQRRAASAERH